MDNNVDLVLEPKYTKGVLKKMIVHPDTEECKDIYHKILLKEFKAKWKNLVDGYVWIISTDYDLDVVTKRIDELNKKTNLIPTPKKQNKKSDVKDDNKNIIENTKKNTIEDTKNNKKNTIEDIKKIETNDDTDDENIEEIKNDTDNENIEETKNDTDDDIEVKKIEIKTSADKQKNTIDIPNTKNTEIKKQIKPQKQNNTIDSSNTNNTYNSKNISAEQNTKVYRYIDNALTTYTENISKVIDDRLKKSNKDLIENVDSILKKVQQKDFRKPKLKNSKISPEILKFYEQFKHKQNKKLKSPDNSDSDSLSSENTDNIANISEDNYSSDDE